MGGEPATAGETVYAVNALAGRAFQSTVETSDCFLKPLYTTVESETLSFSQTPEEPQNFAHYLIFPLCFGDDFFRD
jgi:hypothetical protein